MGGDALAGIRVTIDGAVDLVTDALDLGERDQDLVGLVAHAITALLDKPGASFDEVVERWYDHSPEEVRGWWSSWA